MPCKSGPRPYIPGVWPGHEERGGYLGSSTLTVQGPKLLPSRCSRTEKKLGINNPYTAPSVAFIDPGLTSGVRKYNRFFTMMDCFFITMKSRKARQARRRPFRMPLTASALQGRPDVGCGGVSDGQRIRSAMALRSMRKQHHRRESGGSPRSFLWAEKLLANPPSPRGRHPAMLSSATSILTERGHCFLSRINGMDTPKQRDSNRGRSSGKNDENCPRHGEALAELFRRQLEGAGHGGIYPGVYERIVSR